MITRDDVLTQACDQCMKELYEYAVPHVTWEQFKKECEEYTKKYREWEVKRKDEWKGKPIDECIGPRPFEFYYLPREIMKDVCDDYVHAYNIDNQQNLLDIISILKDYCKNPIIDKWIEGENGDPGHRGYEHPNNLEEELTEIFNPIRDCDGIEMAVKAQDKFFKFLDMAGSFYNWNRDLNSFNMTVYLGPSPNSNKEAVIKNWKKYRNQDIEIDENKIKENYYGEDFDD